jgi:hypothetical protein
MCGAISPLPQYAFKARCLVKHRDNFGVNPETKTLDKILCVAVSSDIPVYLLHEVPSHSL